MKSQTPETQENTGTAQVSYCRITVSEYLEEKWSGWFDGLTIAHAEDGSTTLTGEVRDQTALHGLLSKIRDLGLTLTSVAFYTPET